VPQVLANHLRIVTGLALIVLMSVIASAVAPIVAQGREALVTRGRAPFMEKGCHGCHTIGNVGTAMGPDLSRVGRRYREGDLRRWLGPPVEEPTQGGRMPELEPAERDDASRLLRHMPTPRLNGPESPFHAETRKRRAEGGGTGAVVGG
jgi:mono/diheme cytochrome c family protein